MGVRLKPLEHQVLVITGASSGIGLATARDAAARGARLVLVARNGEALTKIADEIKAAGGRAVAVPADTANQEDIERVVRTAVETFGGFDTWVNNAAVSIYGTLEQIPPADHRRLFDVNYWGVVQGSLAAARHLRRRGGAIINIGSVLSDRTILYQTPYCAAKHAVRGFTDGLRMELEADGAPVSVTLVKPSAIDTLFPEHARNYLDAPSPAVPPPTYDPHLVAKAILFAAETPRRTLTVGSGGAAIGLVGSLFPRMTDYVMEATGYASQTASEPGRPGRRDNLYHPREDGEEHGDVSWTHRRSSLTLEAQMHPVAAVGIAAGLAAAAFALFGRSGGGSARPAPPRDENALRAENWRRYQESRRRPGEGQDHEPESPGRYVSRGRPRPAHERPVHERPEHERPVGH